MVREPEKKNKQQHLKTRANNWVGTKSQTVSLRLINHNQNY